MGLLLEQIQLGFQNGFQLGRCVHHGLHRAVGGENRLLTDVHGEDFLELFAPAGVPVEGELGRVGGKEDDLECAEGGYTVPAEAVRFEAETGLSSMAVGIGTAHGVYKETPVLNVELVGTLAAS